jgi:tRNA G37 N-methylase Trm5
MNAEAMALLKQNIVMNHVVDRVTPILGDVRTIGAEQLGGVADRVIMNLPETAIEHVDTACKMLKSQGGVLHYYEFAQNPTPLKDARDRLARAITRSERCVKSFLVTKKVRETAPFTWQVVLDAEIH